MLHISKIHLNQKVHYCQILLKDLKAIYQAPTEDAALNALDELEEKWGKKYPSSVSSWRNNWPQLSTFLKYPDETR